MCWQGFLGPRLIETAVIIRFYVIVSMGDAVIINYQLFLYGESFVQKQEKNRQNNILLVTFRKNLTNKLQFSFSSKRN